MNKSKKEKARWIQTDLRFRGFSLIHESKRQKERQRVEEEEGELKNEQRERVGESEIH